MKIKILVLFLLILPLISFAQSDYYYYKGNKIYLNLDKKFLYISAENNFQKTSINDLNFKQFELEAENVSINGIINKWSELEFEIEPSNTEYYQKINILRNNDKIDVVLPSFTSVENGERIGLSSFFYVKLKQNADLATLQTIANNKNVVIVEQNQFMPLWYTLKCTKTTIENSLEIANYFFETGLFSASVPDLLTYNDLLCSSDPFFADQWGLNNTGQNGGTVGLDINMCDAWNITEGDNNITIAVLDHGIEFDHPDINNLHPLSFDTESLSSPSLVLGSHGTACAGIIGADKDNNEGVTGISPLCRIMSISNSLSGTANSRIRRADGINWAVDNGADIISNSWRSGVQFEVIDNAIENALLNGRNGLGTIIIFSSGNSNSSVNYPANSNEDILAVGAMSPCGERKNPASCDGETNWGSSFGLELDIIAPGVLIPTTDRQGNNGYNPMYETNPNYSSYLDYFSKFNGTSSACPHAAGLAGLVLSVNPCLSGEQVRDIIESTAQKVGGYSYDNTSERPNGTWNEEMGYGLVDAFAAVQLAQEMNSPTLDLYVKDRPDDMGLEPNPTTDNMWTSEDIWVRNTNDNGLEHQNPEYKSDESPNYIYVRVINKSCVASNGDETLTLNWAKANTALAWSDNWDGTLTNDDGDPLGGELPYIATIPVIEPGQEVIIELPWVVPNPDDYSDNDNPHHFCLLSRIDATDDPLASPMTENPNIMVRNNNNLAWKNLTIVDLETETTASVFVSNISNTARTFFIELQKATNEQGKALFDEAEVSIKMDDILFNAWEHGGKQAQLIDPTYEENKKLVKGNNVILDNIQFEPNEMGLLTLDFNFLTKEITDKTEYTYHVIQKDASTGEVIGGETFIIRKKPRPIFDADAGEDKEIDKNESITISAEEISEAAIYNWYDLEGNLIYTGKDLTVSPNITKKYKLEVIADTDGYKDYDEIEVKVNPYSLEPLVPNPASNQVTINYKAQDATSAYLMVIGTNTGTSNNYILDTSIFETTIDISSYQFGFYTVALVCDGQIVDAKTLLKD
ncbi:MAG: S8 family serine peptidase [Salinivirgaceae bacterium]|nr:S8 family serine peptidase [Salinivirgaceae bacterium]